MALRPKLAAIAVLIAAMACVVTHLFTDGAAPAWGWALAFALSWMSVIDVDRYVLPDFLTLGALLVGLSVRAASDLETVLPGVLGAAVGYVALAGVAAAFRVWRGKDGMGGGDAKLLAAGGAWLGWVSLPIVVLVGSLTGLIFALAQRGLRQNQPNNDMIPFGPFLSAGIWVAWTATFLMDA